MIREIRDARVLKKNKSKVIGPHGEGIINDNGGKDSSIHVSNTR